MFGIRLSQRDLERFFTVNAAGDRLTLRSFIERETEMHEEEITGAGDSSRIAYDEEPNFSAEDINDLVEQYLESMDKDDVLNFAGSSSLDADQLMEEVKNRTTVGLEIIEMILADRSFVERQIRRGNFSWPE